MNSKKKILGLTFLLGLLVSILFIIHANAMVVSNNISVTLGSWGKKPTVDNDKYYVQSTSGTFASAKTGEIFLENTASTDQQVTIACSISIGADGGYVKIDNTEYKTTESNKTISFILAANTQLTITLYAPKGGSVTSITIDSILSVSSTANGVISFESPIGGTYTVNGEAISADTSINCDVNGVAVSATPINGYEFVAWVQIDENNICSEIAGLNASDTLRVETDCRIKPLFAKTYEPIFWANGKIFDSWNNAFSYAGTNYPVLLYKSGTLDAGEYQIDVGQKLLIPYSQEHYTDENLRTTAFGDPLTSYSTGTLATFRKLTLSPNARIICKGQISVNAWQQAYDSGHSGKVAGPYGEIALQENAEIILANNAILYCYGYISGKGTVSAESGSTIHELFQMTDWRGGRVTYNYYEKMQSESFLNSQYYIQNIESHLMIHKGANLLAHVTVYITTNSTAYDSSANLIGDEGLFVLNTDDAYIDRYYDTSNGIVRYELYGKASIAKYVLTVQGSLLVVPVSVEMHTEDYVLNIPSNMSITAKKGAVIDIPYQFKLLPDTVLEIEEGATVNLTSGINSDNETVSGQLILYDYDDWTEGPDEYSWGSDFIAVKYTSTGQKKTSLSGNSAQLIVNGILNISDGAGIYSTNDINIQNGNSALSGSGTIIWNETKSQREKIYELLSDVTGAIEVETEDGKTSKVPVDVTPLQAPLAGLATSPTDYTHSMDYNSTYKGLDNNYWYQYIIKAVATDEDNNPVAATVTGKSNPILGSVNVSNEQTVGYIANSTTENGTFQFTVDTPQDYDLLNVKVGKTELTAVDGVYSLTNVDQDTMIQLNFKKKVTYSIKITWDQTETAVYTVNEETHTWNPLKLLYYKSKTNGSWGDTKSVMSITLDNKDSTGGFTATFDYAPNITSTQTWTGLVDNKLSVAAGKTGTTALTLTPTGVPETPQTGSELTLGTITITLNKE